VILSILGSNIGSKSSDLNVTTVWYAINLYR
jgi:hypothetical protein